MTKLKSEGKCVYCNKMFSKVSIARHLQTHLQEKQGKVGISFFVKVETNPKWGKNGFFLLLWIDGESKMKDIDIFFRNIWLECCGHMSSFTNPINKKRTALWDFFAAQDLLAKSKTDEYETMMEDANGEIPMSRKSKDVFTTALKIDYDYDFGSTTSLQLTVLNEYPIKANEAIVLLSRNEPLQILCEVCEKEPAVEICSVCVGYNENTFCKKCATKHDKTCADFHDYAAMPIVNSPRMGVCAYDGGKIDTERDHPYQNK